MARATERGWSKRFVPAVPLPGGGELETLHDARAYILALPPEVQRSAPWQNAIEALLLVGNGDGPEMFARIGMMKALHAKGEPVFREPRGGRKWTKAKLLRDR